ncbi:MAG: TetR family transcriptional regulator [Leptospira sp.]|nr:TetR family transcriptional regulator [Leptospira sp.]
MKQNQRIWIEKGYESIALHGFADLKVERLAKTLEISKSSFYHLFVDLENYHSFLIDHHLKNCDIISKKESIATSVTPELIDILIDHKLDLLFNKQIRIHLEFEKYQPILNKIDEMLATPFINVWRKDLNLNFSDVQLRGLFNLALENFFLKINSENLEKQWLTDYFSNLKNLIHSIAK